MYMRNTAEAAAKLYTHPQAATSIGIQKATGRHRQPQAAPCRRRQPRIATDRRQLVLLFSYSINYEHDSRHGLLLHLLHKTKHFRYTYGVRHSE